MKLINILIYFFSLFILSYFLFNYKKVIVTYENLKNKGSGSGSKSKSGTGTGSKSKSGSGSGSGVIGGSKSKSGGSKSIVDSSNIKKPSGDVLPVPSDPKSILTPAAVSSTQAPTQAVTQAPTQAVTQAPTQAVTEGPSQVVIPNLGGGSISSGGAYTTNQNIGSNISDTASVPTPGKITIAPPSVAGGTPNINLNPGLQL